MFRYDLASWSDPRVILITEEYGKRSTCPRLGYVVLPSKVYRWKWHLLTAHDVHVKYPFRNHITPPR